MIEPSNKYLEKFKGSFSGILRWPQLDELWQCVQDNESLWYVYQIGEDIPKKALTGVELKQFIIQLDNLIRKDHGESYCGIVYVDDKQQPTFIKVYDPNNLGSTCGSSGAPPPLPGWTLSILAPCDLNIAFPPPANRRRWWKKLFS